MTMTEVEEEKEDKEQDEEKLQNNELVCFWRVKGYCIYLLKVEEILDTSTGNKRRPQNKRCTITRAETNKRCGI
jgi:hypothetical protein